jgi:hypothetical protein
MIECMQEATLTSTIVGCIGECYLLYQILYTTSKCHAQPGAINPALTRTATAHSAGDTPTGKIRPK